MGLELRYVTEHLGKSLPLCGVYFFIRSGQAQLQQMTGLRSSRVQRAPLTGAGGRSSKQY